MADVSISYKGNEIASMNATGVKTLLTSSAFCEDDITVTYTKPAAPVPTLQTKSATYTPSTSQQTDSITADAGYDGLDEVNVTVNAMPSGTAGTPTATKGTVSGNSVSVTPSVTNTTGYITGGTKTGTPVTVSASELVSGTKTISSSGTTDVTNYASASVASGSAATPATTITANPSISVSSGGLITASVSASQSVTPTVSAGYVSSGTAGTVSVSGSNTSQLTTQAAQTITPTTTNQTIASGKYLTGTQTIEGIVCTNLTSENIADGVTVKIGTATDDESVASVTGTHQGGGGISVVTTPDVHGGDIVEITATVVQPMKFGVIRPDAELLQSYTYDKLLVADNVGTWPSYSTSNKTLLSSANLSPTITMSYEDYHYYVLERMYVYPIYNTNTVGAGREEYHFSSLCYEIAQVQENTFNAMNGTPYGTRVFTISGEQVGRLIYWTSSSAMAGYNGTAQGLMINPAAPTASSGVLTIKSPSVTVKGGETYLSSTYFDAVTDCRIQYIIEVYRVSNESDLIGWGNTQQLLRMASCLNSSSHTLT